MIVSFKEETSLSSIKQELSNVLSQSLPLKFQEIYTLLEKPKRADHGHLSLPVFRYCDEYKSSPVALAEKWSQKVADQDIPFLKNVSDVSGFINFEFKIDFLKERLEELLKKKEMAIFQEGEGQHWVFDFASPNVAKHMNVGHLRASVLGQALVNLASRFHLRITALNHLGDWGTQFGKLIWAYKSWSSEYDFETNPLDSLVALYVRFHEEAEVHQERNKEAALLFKKLEEGDKELTQLWKKFIEISLKDYEKYWKMLNVEHNLVLGESFYRQFTDDLIARLNEKNLLKESEGAQVVFLDENIPPCLIVKSDGASTYAARDLSSFFYRFEKLKADKNIYITGSDHKFHFQQIFKTVEKMNCSWFKSSVHVPFGMYRFKGEKMSTRKGRTVYLKDILAEAKKRVESIIENRNFEKDKKEKIALQVGIGAVVFYDLSTDCVKDVDFNWDRLLDFEGRTGPFVQYTYVRCLSLMKKFNQTLPKEFSETAFHGDEAKLMWFLLSFESSVFQSFQLFKPHILANYLLDLSHVFNQFYAQHRILDSERTKDLMILVKGVSVVLKTGLQILNVPQPEEM